jgi:YHS domain-containing protein
MKMKKSLGLLIVLIFISTFLVIFSGVNLFSQAENTGCCKAKVVKCPVCGKVIAQDAMNISKEYKGKTYYFCCEKCKAEFEKNPEKYVEKTTCENHYYCPTEGCQYKSDKPGKCPAHGIELKKHECTPVYVCPMKGCDFKTDKPGKCPKCGMELIKKECACQSEKKCDSPKKEESK